MQEKLTSAGRKLTIAREFANSRRPAQCHARKANERRPEANDRKEISCAAQICTVSRRESYQSTGGVLCTLRKANAAGVSVVLGVPGARRRGCFLRRAAEQDSGAGERSARRAGQATLAAMIRMRRASDGARARAAASVRAMWILGNANSGGSCGFSAKMVQPTAQVSHGCRVLVLAAWMTTPSGVCLCSLAGNGGR